MDMSERMVIERKRSRFLLPGIVILLCILGTLACGCTQTTPGTATPTPTATPAATPPGMANPAAVACKEANLTYEIRTNPDGSQSGVCILSDGTECDGWAYYRGDCPAMPGAGLANPSAVYCEEQGLKYETRKNADGSEYGVCIMADGTVCDGWAYYRNECP